MGLAAESWEANETADVFTFKLVPGATFHNGDPVTSVDCKFAWERIVNPETNLGSPSDISYHLSTVRGLPVRDHAPGTLTGALRRGYGRLPHVHRGTHR